MSLACGGCRPRERAAASPAGAWTVVGVTIDDPWNEPATAEALERLPRKPMARVVLDLGPRPSEYLAPVRSLHAVSEVMAEVVDSSRLAAISPAEYRARTAEFVAALGGEVDVWEIGNEVNGAWTGDPADVAAKIRAAYEVVKARGGRTALTLYYDAGCGDATDQDAFAWAATRVDPGMRRGLDYVWLSYYEEDCEGARPDWNDAFGRLADLFPAAALGIGECGASELSRRPGALRRCYAVSTTAPRFVGGGFWWHFSEDMVPSSKPLWTALARLISPPDAAGHDPP